LPATTVLRRVGTHICGEGMRTHGVMCARQAWVELHAEWAWDKKFFV